MPKEKYKKYKYKKPPLTKKMYNTLLDYKETGDFPKAVDNNYNCKDADSLKSLVWKLRNNPNMQQWMVELFIDHGGFSIDELSAMVINGMKNEEGELKLKYIKQFADMMGLKAPSKSESKIEEHQIEESKQKQIEEIIRDEYNRIKNFSGD